MYWIATNGTKQAPMARHVHWTSLSNFSCVLSSCSYLSIGARVPLARDATADAACTLRRDGHSKSSMASGESGAGEHIAMLTESGDEWARPMEGVLSVLNTSNNTAIKTESVLMLRDRSYDNALSKYTFVLVFGTR